VPDDRLDLCSQAVGNHKRFTELIDEYVGLCEQEVLRPQEDSKKKPTRR
jgi:hypothetical protein